MIGSVSVSAHSEKDGLSLLPHGVRRAGARLPGIAIRAALLGRDRALRSRARRCRSCRVSQAEYLRRAFFCRVLDECTARLGDDRRVRHALFSRAGRG